MHKSVRGRQGGGQGRGTTTFGGLAGRGAGVCVCNSGRDRQGWGQERGRTTVLGAGREGGRGVGGEPSEERGKGEGAGMWELHSLRGRQLTQFWGEGLEGCRR